MEVDGEHLLWALLDQENGLVPRILAKWMWTCRGDYSRPPRLSLTAGPGSPALVRNRAKSMYHQRFSRLLVVAGPKPSSEEDDYISVEHLLMALMAEGEGSGAGKLLKQHWLLRRNGCWRLLRKYVVISGLPRPTLKRPMRHWRNTAATWSRWPVPTKLDHGDWPGRRDPPRYPDPVLRPRTTRF